MAEQKAVDIEAINERGVIFNYNDLKRLSQNIFSWIEAFSKTIQKYDDCVVTKEHLHFWINVAYAKNYVMRKNFCEGDFRERVYGMVEADIWYVVYDYNNDAYYGASVPEAIIYLAFKVQRDEITIEEAIETIERYALLWSRVS